jgi:hypothetical protein
MKQVLIDRYGRPEEVARCADVHVYPIEDITVALAHAQRGERSGKILVAPNGRL